MLLPLLWLLLLCQKENENGAMTSQKVANIFNIISVLCTTFTVPSLMARWLSILQYMNALRSQRIIVYGVRGNRQLHHRKRDSIISACSVLYSYVCAHIEYLFWLFVIRHLHHNTRIWYLAATNTSDQLIALTYTTHNIETLMRLWNFHSSVWRTCIFVSYYFRFLCAFVLHK